MIRGFIGVPDLDAPSGNNLLVWSRGPARPKWSPRLTYDETTLSVGDGTAAAIVRVNGSATVRQYQFATNSINRWSIRANATAESGANAGSDLAIIAFQDGGSAGTTALTITRSTGDITFGSTTAATSTSAAALVLLGGLAVANGAFFAGTFSSSGSTLFGTHDTSKAVGFSRFGASDKYCYLNAGIDSANTSQASTGMVLAVRNSGNAQVLGLSIEETGSVVLGPKSALATNATDGFTYLPTCAGTPTGVPTAFTGKVAFQYDTTNNKLYVYNGAWKATAALT